VGVLTALALLALLVGGGVALARRQGYSLGDLP
jgi:hypothetical protein